MHALLASALLARPLVLAHYMPWYETKAVGGNWGWHWTMNHFDPTKTGPDGRQQLASQFRPSIGAYDSSDPDALECQALQMKVAGIDGVMIDWYGVKDLYDYAQINRNTGKVIAECSKVGLKFSIVMEDQVVPQLVKAGKSTPPEFAQSAMTWLRGGWFKLPGYLRWHGKPVLLMFGPQYYKEPELSQFFGQDEAFFSLLGPHGKAVGAFGWPEPQVGDAESWKHVGAFYDRAKHWSASVAVAYPRFEDIYKAAGVGPGYGEIRDDSGETMRKTLAAAENSGAPFIQVATWNDWGEGTQIEPSVEFGYRDLELLQAQRRRSDAAFPYHKSDLRLPAEIYRLRKHGKAPSKLDQAVQAILKGNCDAAAAIVKGLD